MKLMLAFTNRPPLTVDCVSPEDQEAAGRLQRIWLGRFPIDVEVHFSTVDVVAPSESITECRIEVGS